MALPILPAQGQNPWFTPRNDWDLAVKTELEGRLSASGIQTAVTTYAEPLTVNGQRASRRRDTFWDPANELGLVLDGITDVRGALLAGMIATNARTIVLREGTYRISSRLNQIKQGTVLQGEGPKTVLLVDTTAFEPIASDVLVRDMTIRYTGSGNGQALFETATERHLKNWRFERVIFDRVGFRASRWGSTQDGGVPLTTASGLDSDVEVFECEFMNFTADACFWVRGSNRVTLDRAKIHDIGTSSSVGDAAKYSYGANNGRILNTDFWNCTRDAIDLYDAGPTLVNGNTFTDIGVHAVEAKRTATSFQASSHRIVNNRATRCQLSGSTTSPAFQLAVPYVVAIGNTAEDCTGVGFRVGPDTDDTTKWAFGGVWTGNQALRNGGAGFSSGGAREMVVEGNLARANVNRGFSFDPSVSADIVRAANGSFGNGFADVWPA